MLAAATLISIVSIFLPAESRGGLGAAFSLERPGSERSAAPCVSPALRARLAALDTSSGPSGNPKQFAAPPLVPFFPIGGAIDGDTFLAGFVDVDPAPLAVQDYSCHGFAYDGHRGHDAPLRSFAQQAIGIPVFAIRDGVVALAQDGFPDENVFPGVDDGNYLILDHGDGTQSWYFHLKKHSVAFATAQSVAAGQQVGLAASSGYSFAPHLHFEVQQNGQAYEPFAGLCDHGASGFAKQPRLALETKLLDFGVTTTDLATVPGLPQPWPTDAQIGFADTNQFFWAQGVNLPPNSTYRFRFVRPDQSLEWETPHWPLANPGHWRTFGVWFWFSILGMQSIPGTWTVELEFNGVEVASVPVEVVAVTDPNFNRPPAPIAVALDPASPSPGEVTFCRVATSLVLDDLDLDLVRYRYQWKVNGQVVRDNVFAGHADALPRDAFAIGDTVACTVTPNDGSVDGPSATASAIAQREGFTNLGLGKYSKWDVPCFEGVSTLLPGAIGSFTLAQARPNALALLMIGLGQGNVPLIGGTLVPFPVALTLTLATDANGSLAFPFVWPAGVPSGFSFYAQYWIADPAATAGASASNGIRGTTP
jgi:murein DD-endopeptidase MepM/ murein hydrolase activator NlpD